MIRKKEAYLVNKKQADLDLGRVPSTPFIRTTQILKKYWERSAENNVLAKLYPRKEFKLDTHSMNTIRFSQEGTRAHAYIDRLVRLKRETREVPVRFDIWIDLEISPKLKSDMQVKEPFVSLGSEVILTERDYHIPMGYLLEEERGIKESMVPIYKVLLKVRKENNLVGEITVRRENSQQIVTGQLADGSEVELIYSTSGVLRVKKVNGEVVDSYKKFGEVSRPKVVRTGSSKKK